MALKVRHAAPIAVVALLAALAAVPSAAGAASISVEAGSGPAPATIWIRGKIAAGDERRFAQVAADLDDAVVRLESSGGLTAPAMAIGRMIQALDYSTVVEEARCTSACALIWLAGNPRVLGRQARVGFHATYTGAGGKIEVSAPGNAAMGAYIRGLGLSDTVVAFASMANPEEMNWLTKPIADTIGLSVVRAASGADAHARHNAAIKARATLPPDLPAALENYRKAAAAGFAGSQNNLGDLYETGTGVPKSPKFAIYWYARAAERGEPTAYLSLSTLLSEGAEDREILVEALTFAFLAARQLKPGRNRTLAEANVARLSGRLAAADITRARIAAADWEPLRQERWLMGDAPER